MNRPISIDRRVSIASLSAGFALVFAVNAAAQDLGALNQATGGVDLGSLASGSAGNAAGVLQYCLTNNFLASADLTNATAMKNKLIAKAGGQETVDADSGFTAGAQGNVVGANGKSVNLADLGSLENNLRQTACKAVMDHATSLL
jgi:hypothetical protein